MKIIFLPLWLVALLKRRTDTRILTMSPTDLEHGMQQTLDAAKAILGLDGGDDGEGVLA
jgi:hypothetical protein